MTKNTTEKEDWSRREILKAAGVVGGVLLAPKAMASGPGPAEGEPLAGMIEMHVHPMPDITPRSGNDLDLVIKAREEGMRAIMLKNHEFITNDRAYLVKQMVPGIEVFGGVVLNEPVGGVNPVAVETFLKFSGGCAKCVWLPTHDAAYQKMVDKKGGGVRVTDSSGQVLPEVRKIMQMVAKADVILGTGHVSPKESLAVVKAAQEEGVRKIVVTHAMQDPFFMTIEDMKRCVGMGAIIEHCYYSTLIGPFSPLPAARGRKQVSMDEFAKAIKEVGAPNCFIATDLGQALTPIPAAGLKDFIAELSKRGITKEQIEIMGAKNPARLLGLEPF
jgi:hypothetical protein